MMATGNSARSLPTAAAASPPTKTHTTAAVTPTKTPSPIARDNESHPMLSDSERQYDIGNKGRLTKFERQLKDLDAEADLAFDLNTVGDDRVDPRWSRRRLFSTTHQEQSSRGSSIHQHHHHHHQLQDMSLETDAAGNVVLDESEQNYKGYLTKVQRDFQNMSELDQLERQQQQQQQQHGSSYPKTNVNNNDPRFGSFATFPMDRSNDSYTINNNSSGHLDGLFRATRSALSPRTAGVEYHHSSTRSLLTFGVVVILLVCNMIVSGMMWKATLEMGKHPRHDMSVDALGRLVHTQNDGSAMTQVSIRGTGKTFVLSVSSPLSSQGSLRSDGGEETMAPKHNPYACMKLAKAVDLWKSVMEGVTTTVLLVHNDAVDKTGNEVRMVSTTNTSHHNELGVQLTFQGATQNETHACINTLDLHKTLCIDFSSRLCETSSSSFREHDDTIEYDDGGGEHLHRDWRDLFQTTLAEEPTVVEGSTLGPTHDACKQEQTGQHWCHSFAAVVLVHNS